MKWKIPFVIILAFILFLIIFKTKENFYMAPVKDWNGNSSLRNDRKESSNSRPSLSGADCIQTCLNTGWCRLASVRSTGECELNDNNTGVNAGDNQWKTWVKIPDS